MSICFKSVNVDRVQKLRRSRLTILAADLRLRNDELARVAVVSASQGVLENTNGS